MDIKIKNYLGIVLIISLAVVAVSVFLGTQSYMKRVDPSSFRSFSVFGEGKFVAVPDVARFTFSVVTEGGKDIASLQEQNVEKVNKAIAFVKEKGVDGKDIKTEAYSVEPRYQYYRCDPVQSGSASPCPPSEIVGYTIRQTVSVKVRDFSEVGEILSGVVKNGANTVSSLNFTIDDLTEAQNAARAEAIKKAKAKAETIAEAGGFSLGRLLSIEESGGYYPYPMYAKTMYAEGMGGAGDLAPSIEPGSEDVTISVTLRYEIR